MNNPRNKRLKLVREDPWLEPSEDDLNERYNRFKERLKILEDKSGTFNQFANAYKYFGINYSSKDKGWYYREWAPAAHALYFFGDFNDWDRNAHPMQRKENGIWEIFLDERTYKKRFVHGSRIKVRVDTDKGSSDRIPAYIRRVVQDEHTKDYCGQVWLPGRYKWEGDKPVLTKNNDLYIYEAHIGMAQEKEGVGTYREFTENVLPHIKHAGYNAIQLMAIAEHPYYGSFGYHVSNFFAPSSRFGTPEDLKQLVKTAHQMGIAVIMDLVHSHTVKNVNEGINDFDGSNAQYFHPGERGEHPHWDSRLFDYGKVEVLQFLLSNIKYWMQEFHFDGFRFDGVGSMMYFHHGYESFDRREKFFR
ncbi:MAG: 1,4-alpha-glucan-branching enzyme, partial [Bacteroidales bacterium]|nr:1,4-alpha-glucan-branching enzyme [Bacteroidales bacterium]